MDPSRGQPPDLVAPDRRDLLDLIPGTRPASRPRMLRFGPRGSTMARRPPPSACSRIIKTRPSIVVGRSSAFCSRDPSSRLVLDLRLLTRATTRFPICTRFLGDVSIAIADDAQKTRHQLAALLREPHVETNAEGCWSPLRRDALGPVRRWRIVTMASAYQAEATAASQPIRRRISLFMETFFGIRCPPRPHHRPNQRRRQCASRAGRALGRRRQHLDGLGGDDPGLGADRRTPGGSVSIFQ